MNPVEAALLELRDALRQFLHLLQEESRSLQDIHADTLSSIVAEKSRWAEIANTAWNRLVIACGVDTRRGDSLEAALATHPELQGTWREVRQLAEDAGRINQGNSVLIEAQMRRTRQALDVLQSAANRGSLYGSDGLMVDAFRSQHSLSKV